MPVSGYKFRKIKKTHKVVKTVHHLAGTKPKRAAPGSGARRTRTARRHGSKGRQAIRKRSTRLAKSVFEKQAVKKMMPVLEQERGQGHTDIVIESIDANEASERDGIVEGSSEKDEQHNGPVGETSPGPEILNQNHSAAFEEGFRQGFFEGGEGKVSRFIPRYVILPELSVDDVISAGVSALSSSLYPLMSPAHVFEEIRYALDHRLPLSVVRLGDGELLTLAHEIIIPVEQARSWGKFLPYAGVQLPDHSARESLAQSIRCSDIVGIPESRHPSYQGLLFPVLQYYGLSYRNLKLTSSTINYALNEEALLRNLLAHRKILLIGNQAPELSVWLQNQGYEIVGVIAPVYGVGDVQRIMDQAVQPDFDIALVAAGIAAVVICSRIAREKGKVALDMGHLANMFVKGTATLL
ncbi:hypothetical protein D3C76_100430 [compost metagenome]